MTRQAQYQHPEKPGAKAVASMDVVVCAARIEANGDPRGPVF